MNIEHPYLLFLGDASDALAVKTARGVGQWRHDWCLGQLRLPGCIIDLGLPDLTPEAAAAQGARTLVIGVANQGGYLPKKWIPILTAALEAGLDLANGLHDRLTSIPEIRDRAAQQGRKLHDLRIPPRDYPIGTGIKRPGKRVLAVGTDCSVGKMYAALAIEKALSARGVKADFRATGQTGILIAGDGVPLDAVIADFIAGAIETLTPANAPDHWDIVEGQGSLHHPSFAGVSTGLLHGAQPDALILCHEPTRTHMRGLPHMPIPSFAATMEANLRTARLVNPEVRFVGVCVNTIALDEATAHNCLKQIAEETDLPTTDPVRYGAEEIAQLLI